MKKGVFLLLFVLVHFITLNAQVSKPIVTVSAEAMKVLYIGIDNPIQVSVSGIPQEKIKVTVSEGTITPMENGKYNVKVKPGTRTVKVNVGEDVNGVLKSLGSSDFRVKSVPDPIAKIGNFKGGIITKDQLLNANELDAVMENFDFNMTFEITEFSFSALLDNGDLVERHTSGNKIPDSIKELFKNIKQGGKCYFENIKAKGPDGSIRILGAMNFIIG